MPLALLLVVGLVLLARRSKRPRRNPYRRRRNVEVFTDATGEHPIRASQGYLTGIDEVRREEQEHARSAERYHGIREEKHGRLGGGVDRPGWAVGYTNAQLERIARDHGQRASDEGWYEKANLVKGSGELRTLLREGGYREEKSRKGAAQQAAPRRGAQQARRRYKPVEALPF